MIVFGSQFLLNLILAVIMTNFTKIYQSDEVKELKKKAKALKTGPSKKSLNEDDTTSSEEEEDINLLIPSPERLSMLESPEQKESEEEKLSQRRENANIQIIEEELK